MQPWISCQEPQQCHCSFWREQFLFNDLYDTQTDKRLWKQCALSIPVYYLFSKFRDERKVRDRTIILHLFLIQPRSLKQRGYGGSFQTQRHHWLIHWPIDNWPSVEEVDPRLSSKGKWIVDPSHMTCSETWLLSPWPQAHESVETVGAYFHKTLYLHPRKYCG